MKAWCEHIFFDEKLKSYAIRVIWEFRGEEKKENTKILDSLKACPWCKKERPE